MGRGEQGAGDVGHDRIEVDAFVEVGDGTQWCIPDSGAEDQRDGGRHRQTRVVEATGSGAGGHRRVGVDQPAHDRETLAHRGHLEVVDEGAGDEQRGQGFAADLADDDVEIESGIGQGGGEQPLFDGLGDQGRLRAEVAMQKPEMLEMPPAMEAG